MKKLEQMLDSDVDASQRGEHDDAGSLLPPPESLLEEKQNISPQSANEPHAGTKNGCNEEGERPFRPLGSLGDEVQRNPGSLEVVHQPSRHNSTSDASHQYDRLIELLCQQEQKCRKYCQQSTHMGNITETTKFESLAEECLCHTEALREAQAKGYPVPKFQMEDRIFYVFKIIPEISGQDMLLTISRGLNLPAPEGLSSNDLETSVRFEFPFPSSKEAQRDQTRSVKNSSSPEFGEQFTLHIKPSHRGFKRVLAKGIKFEIVQKGGLFKTDKVVGSAQLKLDSLENDCETRQLIEVLKRQTPTGGYLEVQVKVREPLSGPQSRAVTEKWLVLDPLTLPLVSTRKPQLQDAPAKKAARRSITCSVL